MLEPASREQTAWDRFRILAANLADIGRVKLTAQIPTANRIGDVENKKTAVSARQP